MAKSFLKYHILWPGQFEVITNYVCSVSLDPEYCCVSLNQAVTSQAGQKKLLHWPFYGMIHMKNDRIQHFYTIYVLQLWKLQIMGAWVEFGTPACDVTAP